MSAWVDFRAELQDCLSGLIFTDANGLPLSPEEGFLLWAEQGKKLRDSGNCLYCIGNGASASMASHYAADIGKNGRIRAFTFTDAALLTAIGNDISFEQIYAQPLLRSATEHDMLLTISSSGNSLNIIAAIKAATEIGMHVVTLSAMRPDNKCRSLGMLNIYVPAGTYGLAETAHSAILHHWTDMLVAQVEASRAGE